VNAQQKGVDFSMAKQITTDAGYKAATQRMATLSMFELEKQQKPLRKTVNNYGF
jgi:hypothetical protein